MIAHIVITIISNRLWSVFHGCRGSAMASKCSLTVESPLYHDSTTLCQPILFSCVRRVSPRQRERTGGLPSSKRRVPPERRREENAPSGASRHLPRRGRLEGREKNRLGDGYIALGAVMKKSHSTKRTDAMYRRILQVREFSNAATLLS